MAESITPFSGEHCMPIVLPPAQILAVTGADAAQFAHAQFSSDVRALANGHWQWSTWLSPQGRVRALFALLRIADDTFRAVLRGGEATDLRAALQPYVLRTRVELTASQVQALGCDDGAEVAVQCGGLPAPHDDTLTYTEHAVALALPGAQPRWLVLRDDDAGATAAAAAANAEAMRWCLQDIRAGLPSLAAPLHNTLLPQWLGLDRLSAFSVRKGCYPGQEVVARLHFKGGNKRSLYRIALSGTAHPPAPGTALHAPSQPDRRAGTIVCAATDALGNVEALASIDTTLAEAHLGTGEPGGAEISVIERFD